MHTVIGETAAALTAKPPLTVRRRIDGRTRHARRIRELAESFSAALGHPTDTAALAAITSAAELITAAEMARAALLRGVGDIDGVVRLENLAARAARKLSIKSGPPPHVTLRDRLAAEAASEAE